MKLAVPFDGNPGKLLVTKELEVVLGDEVVDIITFYKPLHDARDKKDTKVYLFENGTGLRIIDPALPYYFVEQVDDMHTGDEAEKVSHQVAATAMKKKISDGVFARTLQTWDIHFPDSARGGAMVCKLGQFGSPREKEKRRVKTNFRVIDSVVFTSAGKDGAVIETVHQHSYLWWRLIIDGDSKPLQHKADEEEESDDEDQFTNRMSRMNVTN